MKYALIGLGLAFGLGGCLGSNLSSEPPPEFIEVPHTKIVYESAPPPVEVPVMPESCVRAVALADSISRAADTMYNKGTEQLVIISDVRRILAGGDGDLSEVENRQRDLQGHTVGELFDVSEALSKYQSIYKICKKELS